MIDKIDHIINKLTSDKKNTGLSEVQIALLSERIANITKHLKSHKHDHSSRRGLMILVGFRKRLIKYLQNKDFKRYQLIIKLLNIRK